MVRYKYPKEHHYRDAERSQLLNQKEDESMGFKIIRDFISDDGTSVSGTESTFPRHALQAVMGVPMDDPNYLYQDGEYKIRLLDDDELVYFHAYVDDLDFSASLALEWGTRYAGAVILEVHIESYERDLDGRPLRDSEKSLISKDGRWIGYMG